jgi:hypothetical protein
LALTVADYDESKRSMTDGLARHEEFWELLRASFAELGVPRVALAREDTDDGAIIQLPTQAAKGGLVAQLPDRMLAELRRYNAVRAGEVTTQLRVAVHAGEIRPGSHGGTAGDAISYAFRLLEAPETKSALKQSRAALALIVSSSFYREVLQAGPASDAGSYHRIRVSLEEVNVEAWVRLLGVVTSGFPVRGSLSPVAGEAFPMLVEALLAVPCVRSAESRRLLLELFARREIADVIPYHAEDRLHVIALARTCRRFTHGLTDLLETIRTLEPDSPQVAALAAIIDEW